MKQNIISSAIRFEDSLFIFPKKGFKSIRIAVIDCTISVQIGP